MKVGKAARIITIYSVTLGLVGCASNPGNLSSAVMTQAAQTPTKTDQYVDYDCSQLDTEVRETYLSMQPKEQGLFVDLLNSGAYGAKTYGMARLDSYVPGVSFVNTIVNRKKGQEKATAMLGGQMSASNKLQSLQAVRVEKGCPGNILDLFEEK